MKITVNSDYKLKYTSVYLQSEKMIFVKVTWISMKVLEKNDHTLKYFNKYFVQNNWMVKSPKVVYLIKFDWYDNLYLFFSCWMLSIKEMWVIDLLCLFIVT